MIFQSYDLIINILHLIKVPIRYGFNTDFYLLAIFTIITVFHNPAWASSNALILSNLLGYSIRERAYLPSRSMRIYVG